MKRNIFPRLGRHSFLLLWFCDDNFSRVFYNNKKREFLILKIELTANVEREQREHRDSVLIVRETAPAVGKIKEICFPFVCLPK